jgi:MinD-like ATPase involved in chromosome partitioning or flagellar assembly
MFRNHKTIFEILKRSTMPSHQEELSSISDIISAVEKKSRWAANNIREVCRDLDFYVVFNQARKASETQLGVKLRDICLKHLCFDLNFSGVIFHNEEVSSCVFKMRPISLASPEALTTKTLQRVATHVMNRIINRAVKGDRLDSFEAQLDRVMNHAQIDYESNILNQKRFQREKLKAFTAQGSSVKIKESK